MPLSKKQKAWALFSEWVRRSEKGICYTCGQRYWNEELGRNDWKRMDAGHYKHNVLDFDPLNIHCQCKKCNKWLHGNGTEYSIRLIRQFGLGKVEDLHRRATKALKGEHWDYNEIINVYKEILTKLT